MNGGKAIRDGNSGTLGEGDKGGLTGGLESGDRIKSFFVFGESDAQGSGNVGTLSEMAG